MGSLQERGDRLGERLRSLGYDSLWSWLADHPDLDWVEVGDQLGFMPVLVMCKSEREAPTFRDAVRQGLLREIREFFPHGWDADDRVERAMVAGKLAGFLGLRGSPDLRKCLGRLDALTKGWRPTGPDDPALIAATEGLFATRPDRQ